MWFKVDDTFWGHPKAAGMNNDSLATWMRGGNWSGWQLTDGALPRAMLAQCAGDAADPDAVAADLVDRRLWEPSGTGWQYHDWSDYNPTRAQVLDKRKKDAARRRDWLSRARAARGGDHGVNHDVSSGVSHGVISPTSDDTDDHSVSSGVSSTVHHANPDPTRPEGSGGVQVGEHHQHRNAHDDDDGPRPNNQAGYLLDTVIIDAFSNHPQRPRRITREQATAVRARLPGYTRADHPDAYLVKVIMNDPDPGRLLAGAPPGSTALPPASRALCRRCSRPGHPTEQCPTLAPGTSPAHDADTATHGAKAARETMATRERPATAPAAAAGPELHGEALARAQAAQARAERGADPAPWPDGPDWADTADDADDEPADDGAADQATADDDAADDADIPF